MRNVLSVKLSIWYGIKRNFSIRHAGRYRSCSFHVCTPDKHHFPVHKTKQNVKNRGPYSRIGIIQSVHRKSRNALRKNRTVPPVIREFRTPGGAEILRLGPDRFCLRRGRQSRANNRIRICLGWRIAETQVMTCFTLIIPQITPNSLFWDVSGGIRRIVRCWIRGEAVLGLFWDWTRFWVVPVVSDGTPLTFGYRLLERLKRNHEYLKNCTFTFVNDYNLKSSKRFIRTSFAMFSSSWEWSWIIYWGSIHLINLLICLNWRRKRKQWATSIYIIWNFTTGKISRVVQIGECAKY